MKNLEEYIKERETEFEKIKKEIGLLRSAKMPLKVRTFDDEEFELFSSDYSLATDFKIEKRNEHLGGTSGYDGGYSTERYESYPQFYFNLRFDKLFKPVYIQHEGFDKDKRILIRSVKITRGTKDYSDMNSRCEDSIDLEKVYDFFRVKGVKPVLLDRLARRIKEASEF